MGLPVPAEVWIRVLGVVAAILGYYYWVCGSANLVEFFRASIRGRIGFAVLVVLLIVLFKAPLQLLLFAGVDLAGAVWTALAMRKPAAQAS
jgi:hypothetical protein